MIIVQLRWLMSRTSSSPDGTKFAPELVPCTRHANTSNMDDRALVGGQPATVLSGLLEFCVFSVSTCLSRDAGQLCVSVGLGSLSALSLLLSFFLWVSYESVRAERCETKSMEIFLGWCMRGAGAGGKIRRKSPPSPTACWVTCAALWGPLWPGCSIFRYQVSG